MSTFTNITHHVVAETINGVEVVHAAGDVWEATGDEAKAWDRNPCVARSSEGDEERAAAAQAVRDSGRDPRDDGMPSGTITSIAVPTHSDHARGLVRDDVEVAQQPTLPVTGGGDLQAVPDEKASRENTGAGEPNFTALEGAHAGDVFDGMDDDELRVYAETAEIDLGRSTSRNGIITKIRAAEAERAEAAEDAAGADA